MFNIYVSTLSALQPWLTSNLRIHDTCGVHNLHGMPAVISAIASAIYASMVTLDDYKSELQDIFPAMVQGNNNGTATKIMGVSFTHSQLHLTWTFAR